jgi:hypothetical protein
MASKLPHLQTLDKAVNTLQGSNIFMVLLKKFRNYGRKSFIKLVRVEFFARALDRCSRALYYKTFYTRN